MNTLAFPINAGQCCGGGSIPANVLYNNTLGTATAGSFAVFDGANNVEVNPSSQIFQTNLGVNVTTDLNVNGIISTDGYSNLNETISHIQTLLVNLTGIQT